MSIPQFVDGETELDAVTLNRLVNAANGSASYPIALAGIEGALGDWSGFVNARDHGALGNGTLDDIEGLRDAVTATPAGGTLYIPGGGRTYLMRADTPYTKGVLVNKPMQIVSDGAVLFAHEDSPDGIRMVEIVNTADVTVEGCTFNPNGVTGATCCYLKNTSFARIAGNHFDDPQSGGMLLDGNATDIQFSGNRVRGRGFGVLANDQSGHARVLVEGNTFDGEGLVGDAVEFNGIDQTHYDISVIGNTITNYAGANEHVGFGIGLANVTRGVVSGNTVRKTTRSGIHVECLSEGIVIDGNLVHDCDHGGIEVQSELGKLVKSVAIRGNIVRNCAHTPDASHHLGRGGIDLGISVYDWLASYGTRYLSVQGNLIEGCYGAGIYATGVTESSIVGNLIRDVEGDSVDQVHAIHNTGIHLISCNRTLYALNQVADNRGGSATTYYPYYTYGDVVGLLGLGNQAYGTLGGSQDISTGHGRAMGMEIGNTYRFDGGSGRAGFYGATPIVKQTGVAVSAAGIHAALVNLGLISA